VTHCRQVMLEELQRRNFAPIRSRPISTPSSNSRDISNAGPTGSIRRISARTRRICCASGSCDR
jgi:hypothetical protein